MKFAIRIAFTFLIAATLVAVAEISHADQPRDGVLLLRNGQVLAGHISVDDEFYTVKLQHGEIQIAKPDVEFLCSSLQECYLRRRTAIRFGTADDHLQLADWCLGHKLFDEARVEFADAKMLGANVALIRALEHRLNLALHPPRSVEQAPEQAAETSAPLDGDLLVRELPPGSVEAFTKTIQPVLINGCSATSCHGSAARNDFQLVRLSRGRVTPRRITLRNLHSALDWIDTESPNSSQLLKNAIEAHGPRSAGALEPNSEAFRYLSAWVGHVTRQTAATPAPESLPRSNAALSQTMSPQAGARDTPQFRQSIARRSQAAAKSPPAASSKERPASTKDSPAPRDPFDPQTFNQRFRQSQQ